MTVKGPVLVDTEKAACGGFFILIPLLTIYTRLADAAARFSPRKGLNLPKRLSELYMRKTYFFQSLFSSKKFIVASAP